MKKCIRYTTRVGMLALACCATAAFADTGSERVDAQVSQLQQQIGARHQLAKELLKNALALGYSVPEIAGTQSESMVAKADDDGFTLAMNHLHKTMTMFAMSQ